jgi:hypothetical protein
LRSAPDKDSGPLLTETSHTNALAAQPRPMASVQKETLLARFFATKEV